MKRAVSFILSGFVAATLFAQGSAIKGKVLDEDGNPIPFVNVYVTVGGNFIGDDTDMNGDFKISGLTNGTYDVTVSSIEYDNHVVTGVSVEPDKTRILDDIIMGAEGNLLTGVVVTTWTEPLIDPEDPGKATMKAVEIEQHANANNFLALLSSMSSDIVQLEGSNQVVIRGGRPTSLMYFIDGVKQPGQLNGVIGSSISSITTYTGGIPAKYGDTTSGVISVETKSYFELYEEANGKIRWEDEIMSGTPASQ